MSPFGPLKLLLCDSLMPAGSPGPLQSASLREFLSSLPACAGEPSRDAVQQMIITQDLPYRWHPKYIVFALLFRNCQLRMTTEESVIPPLLHCMARISPDIARARPHGDLTLSRFSHNFM
jgi:hypothetical protein